MPEKRFSNQTPEQIISHLTFFLRNNMNYNLYIDPLGIYYEIKEARGGVKQDMQLPANWNQMSQKECRDYRHKKRRGHAKIRSVKKGRTVSLKGREY